MPASHRLVFWGVRESKLERYDDVAFGGVPLAGFLILKWGVTAMAVSANPHPTGSS